MADANAAFVTLACVQGTLTLALVGATVYYAYKTKDIASAGTEQAKASVKMAEEMREQRMALDRPNLLIRWEGTDPPNLVYVPGRISDEELARFPTKLSFTVYNDGPGPAKMLSASCDDFLSEPLDYLLSKEPWTCTLEGHGLPSAIRGMLGAGDDSQAVDRGLISINITYSDVHDRRWETRLKLSKGVDSTGSAEEPDEMCLWFESGGEQHTVGPYSPEVQE